MAEPLDDLYRDIVMDHYRNPRGKRKLPEADFRNEGKNPMCGDEIEMQVKLNGDRIEDVHIGCVGCAISVSSASMLAEVIKGKSVGEVREIARRGKAVLRGEPGPGGIDIVDLEVLEGIKKFPVRVKCALLSWTTLMDGLDSFELTEKPTVSTTE